jgi:GAF domain-containing protein
MMDAATERLGRHLGVAQVGFAEVDEAGSHITVHRDWSDGRVPSVVGTWRMDDFGPGFIRQMKSGATIVISDVEQDPLTNAPEVLAAYAGIGTRAILDRGLLRDGRMTAILFLHHHEPRVWTTTEVALTEEVAERLWSAVEQARAERQMMDSEARARDRLAELDQVYRHVPVGLFALDRDYRFTRINERLAEMNGLP